MAITTVVGRRVFFSDKKRFRAIVGSTKASPAVLQSAYDFGRQSVLDGYVVVSGLAIGVDTKAHEGALSVEGDFVKTVAVLSTSPHESVYPNQNYQLAQQIKDFGAVIHVYKSKAIWERGVRFGQPQKRLVERDSIQAYLSGEVYAVAEEAPITGGTRWALNYGKHLEIPTFRLGVDGSIHEDFEYKVEPRLITWKMELDYKAAGEELVSGEYDFWELK
jgi:hypothetical protein